MIFPWEKTVFVEVKLRGIVHLKNGFKITCNQTSGMIELLGEKR